MKKIFIASLLFLGALIVWASNVTAPLTPAVTAIAANTTNTTAGTTLDLGPNPPHTIHLFLRATGTAASTNGTLVTKYEVSYDGSTWTQGRDSNLFLTMSTLGAATNHIDDWFVLAGARYLRVGRIENTFAGPCSNLLFNAAYTESR